MFKSVSKSWLSAVSLIFIASILCLFMFSSQALAKTGNRESSGGNKPVSVGAADPKEIEAFSDSFFNEKMKKEHIPGAVISVVRDGKVIFKKGYGYSDIEKKVPVDPDKTVFYICSTGKLFTGTAVMQLYENNRIRLDDDVSKYLEDLKVKNSYSKPVTFENLLTHTSGIDGGSFIGGGSRTREGTLSYVEFMKMKNTKVLKEPGLTTRYSNFGYNLLGLLVQDISGMTYQDYVRKNILDPLGMKDTSVGGQPGNMAVPYVYADGRLMPTRDKVYYPALGEGSIFTTAADMGKFMIAHLQNGQYEGGRILKENTARLMHEQHFTNNSKIPGMAYTFLQDYKNGQKGIKHEGADASGFTTSLFLLPEHNLGFFVAINALNGLPVTFEEEFLNHYFPAPKGRFPEPPSDFKGRAQEYTGTYRSYDDIAVSTIAKIMCLFSSDGELKVSDNGDGTLMLKGMSMDMSQYSTRLVEIGPMLFQREDNGEYLAFKRDKNGKVAYAFDEEPVKTYDRLEWYETGDFNLILLLLCIIVFAVSCIAWAAGWFRRFCKRKPSGYPRLAGAARLVAGLSCFLNVVCLAGFFILIAALSAGNSIVFGLPVLGYIELSGLMAGGALTAAAAVLSIVAWKKRFWSLPARIHYSVVVLAGIAFLWFLNFWNVLGFRLQ